MSLAETPINYNAKEAPYKFFEGTSIQGTDTNATLVRVPAPTFYPYRDGVGETRVTTSSLYSAEGFGDAGEVVVHNEVLEPLVQARSLIREAGFELAIVSGFSTPRRAQRKFVEIRNRLHEVHREQKGRSATTAEEVRIGRLASSVGTPALLSSANQKKSNDIRRNIMYENFAGLIAPPEHNLFNLAEELHRYRGNVQQYSDRYTENICPPIIYTAVNEENFGRSMQCVLTSLDKPECALNMGIGIDIPDASLQAPNAFEEMNLPRLRFLVNDNPLAKGYFIECGEYANQETLNNIMRRRRVLYNAMTCAGFARGKRQGMFTLPAEPTDLPPRHHMFTQGEQFGHTW